MERLSYEDYIKYGGECSTNDFPALILDAETYLQKVTFNRIDNYTLDSKAKRLIVLIIKDLLDFREFDANVSSYSDGIESISYNNNNMSDEAKEKRLYNLCKTYLPNHLLYRGIGR